MDHILHNLQGLVGTPPSSVDYLVYSAFGVSGEVMGVRLAFPGGVAAVRLGGDGETLILEQELEEIEIGDGARTELKSSDELDPADAHRVLGVTVKSIEVYMGTQSRIHAISFRFDRSEIFLFSAGDQLGFTRSEFEKVGAEEGWPELNKKVLS